MKYKKCPRCGLNYVKNEDVCSVCANELSGKRSVFDDEDSEEILCPYCEKNCMGIEDVMCKQCERRRKKRLDTE